MATAIPTACSCGNTLEMAASLAVRTWPNEGLGGNAVASRARLLRTLERMHPRWSSFWAPLCYSFLRSQAFRKR